MEIKKTVRFPIAHVRHMKVMDKLARCRVCHRICCCIEHRLEHENNHSIPTHTPTPRRKTIDASESCNFPIRGEWIDATETVLKLCVKKIKFPLFCVYCNIFMKDVVKLQQLMKCGPQCSSKNSHWMVSYKKHKAKKNQCLYMMQNEIVENTFRDNCKKESCDVAQSNSLESTPLPQLFQENIVKVPSQTPTMKSEIVSSYVTPSQETHKKFIERALPFSTSTPQDENASTELNEEISPLNNEDTSGCQESASILHSILSSSRTDQRRKLNSKYKVTFSCDVDTSIYVCNSNEHSSEKKTECEDFSNKEVSNINQKQINNENEHYSCSSMKTELVNEKEGGEKLCIEPISQTNIPPEEMYEKDVYCDQGKNKETDSLEEVKANAKEMQKLQGDKKMTEKDRKSSGEHGFNAVISNTDGKGSNVETQCNTGQNYPDYFQREEDLDDTGNRNIVQKKKLQAEHKYSTADDGCSQQNGQVKTFIISHNEENSSNFHYKMCKEAGTQIKMEKQEINNLEEDNSSKFNDDLEFLSVCEFNCQCKDETTEELYKSSTGDWAVSNTEVTLRKSHCEIHHESQIGRNIIKNSPDKNYSSECNVVAIARTHDLENKFKSDFLINDNYRSVMEGTFRNVGQQDMQFDRNGKEGSNNNAEQISNLRKISTALSSSWNIAKKFVTLRLGIKRDNMDNTGENEIPAKKIKLSHSYCTSHSALQRKNKKRLYSYDIQCRSPLYRMKTSGHHDHAHQN